MRNLKPPLKWAGGKRWLVPHLRPLWRQNSHRRLVEPFCGGLAVTLGLNPRIALLNDINPHLINFYHWLQQGLEANFTSEENDKSVFYARRERFNDYIKQANAHSRDAAVLFYYLNRTCFNGLCRFNKKGFFNVPFGKYNHINYMTRNEFLAYKVILEKWQFQQGDFEQVKLTTDDFVYADPPYDVEFTSYSQEDFTWNDQLRLVEWLKKHSGPVIISNQATDRIVDLYQSAGFELHFLEAPRRISSDGDRTPAKEVIALRNIEWIQKPEPQQLKLL